MTVVSTPEADARDSSTQNANWSVVYCLGTGCTIRSLNSPKGYGR